MRSAVSIGRRVATVLAAALLTAGVVGAVAGSAEAAPASVVTVAPAATSLDGTWSCNVPVDYVYDEARQVVSDGCGVWGGGLSYHLRTPADGVVACMTARGMTYDQKLVNTKCSGNGTLGVSIRMRTVADGLWACTQVPGMTYDQVKWTNVDCGNVLQYTTAYHLRTPADGLWACMVPAGWSSDQTRVETGRCASATAATSYRLTH
jgi:hypothetical protein